MISIILIFVAAWFALGLITWRRCFRSINEEYKPSTWSRLLGNLFWATMLSMVAGSVFVVSEGLQWAIGNRFDPMAVAQYVEGMPKGERLEARIKELEAENERLDEIIAEAS